MTQMQKPAPFTQLTPVLQRAEGGVLPSMEITDEFIYVIGQIKADFPNLAVQREFEYAWLAMENQQAGSIFLPAGYAPSATPVWGDKNEQAVIFQVLSSRLYRYLARELKWTLINSYCVNSLKLSLFENDVYLLEPSEYNMSALIGAMKPVCEGDCDPDSLRPDTLIAGIARIGNGADLNQLTIHKIKQLDPQQLADQIKEITRYDNSKELQQVMEDMHSLLDNEGFTDQDRAMNYVICNNPLIYIKSHAIYYGNKDRNNTQPQARFVGVRTQAERSGERHFMKVIFDYQYLTSGATESWFSLVDVTDEYPFLLIGFKPYIASY